MSPSPATILLIDDDPGFVKLATLLLEHHGYRSVSASTEAEAMRVVDVAAPDVILLDQQLGETDGRTLIRPLMQHLMDVPIVLVTAHSSVESAVQAIKLGAFDFLPKPLDEARLVATLAKATEHGKLVARVRNLEGRYRDQARFEELVGASSAMQTIYRIIDNVAPTEAGVLIIGESGTGKELVARAIHRRSRRCDGPFVALNMGAVPKELVESTLFGHERGAFTGAERKRIGACEEAAGGTLFLDEIREMPIETQPKLLRFLQERVFRRVGGSADIAADVRIVSATNGDPIADVRDGRLRGDLYYRLNVVPVFMPPLRERGADVGLLATYALRQMSRRHGKSFESIEDAALERLASCPWPGNVRQLFHTIERIVVLNQGPVLTDAMLPMDLDAATPPDLGESVVQPVEMAAAPVAAAAGSVAPGAALQPPAPAGEDDVIPLSELERRAILTAIEACGSAAKAARSLGISEATIYRRLREYGEGDD
ncbi:MAG: sigma-54-dependent transcriptional regulator [Planctomycetota bacterium]|jgi:two-component system repressor protein LuxO